MRILITGAGRAIGAATATVLEQRGHQVVATARDVELLDSVPATLRLALDVRSAQSVRSALDQAGELDAIVNNAVITGTGPLEEFPIDLLREMFETNALGPLRLVQAVVPAWRERGSGVIVNISSVQGRVACPLGGPYSATKYALEALSESLHYELSHFGIRTVVVEPGYIAPGMKSGPKHVGPAAYGELWDEWTGTDTKLTGPHGRPGPELVAHAIADAIEDGGTSFRVPVGGDAQVVLSARRQLGDAEFEAAMRSMLGYSW